MNLVQEKTLGQNYSYSVQNFTDQRLGELVYFDKFCPLQTFPQQLQLHKIWPEIYSCKFKIYISGRDINFFFLIATWLLNSSKWQPIQKKLVAIFKDKQNLFFTLSSFQKLCQGKIFTKWTLGWMICNVQAHLNLRWRLVIDRDACAAFWKQT